MDIGEHTASYSTKAARNALIPLNEGIQDRGVLDFSIRSFEDHRLTMVGSFDLDYYQDVQIEFSGVSYLSCPSDFSDASFRELHRDECADLIEFLGESLDHESRVFAVDIEDFYNVHTHYIVADDVDFQFGKVYYYPRENLEPGESIAPWVIDQAAG